MAQVELQKAIKEIGLSIKSEFIPFSQSRNKGEKYRSLNWKVTLVYNGKDVLTTDYSSGEAHCPSYKGIRRTIYEQEMIEFETENGFHAYKFGSLEPKRMPGTKRIEPNILDVVYSLVIDSDVIDYSSLEDWANSFGYDSDSRNTETIYKQCLSIVLALRNGIGESNLVRLREACVDY